MAVRTAFKKSASFAGDAGVTMTSPEVHNLSQRLTVQRNGVWKHHTPAAFRMETTSERAWRQAISTEQARTRTPR